MLAYHMPSRPADWASGSQPPRQQKYLRLELTVEALPMVSMKEHFYSGQLFRLIPATAVLQ